MKNKRKLVIGIVAVILLLHISIVSCTSFTANDQIHVKLLNNAGVMIETEDTRIYIDPFDLPSD
ncbi:MAG: hypothetical protein ACXAC2_20280, partial [Candidatus Kariarchaeaceae archaeon]